MSSAAEKILTILNELEPVNDQNNRSAEEIAKILLGESSAETKIEQSHGFQPEKCRVERQQTPLIDRFPMEASRNAANDAWQLNYYRDIYSCRPVIGKLIVFAKRVVRKILKFLIEPITEEQTRFNSAAVNTLNAIRNNDVVFEAYIAQLLNAVADNQQKLREMQELVQKNEEMLRQMEQYTAACTRELSELRDTQCGQNEQMHRLLAEQEAALGEVQNRLNKEMVYEHLDYFDFEDHFRGNRRDIKENQKHYLPYFEGCSQVLDLGSGRGEFLELLKENGVDATGVDNYQAFVDYCLDRDLKVVKADAVEYLKKQEKNSCDGITAFQLAEHLSTDDLIALCKESYRVLEAGRALVIETPNPTCLSTYINSFYLDPSHSKPVHPKMLEYLLKKAGFRDIQVVLTEQSKTGYRLPLLAAVSDNLAEFNDGVNFMSDIVFGSQDYAIIAVK